MSEELELATLHSDDRLLDCLAGRNAVAEPDVVAGLLAAFAAEVDTAPVLLAEARLLAIPVMASVAAADGQARVPAPAQEPGDPIEPGVLPGPRRLRRFPVLPRTAAAAGAVALVLGIGGAAAAVGGDVGPLGHFKQFVGTVSEQVGASPSREDRAASLLNQAHAALRAGDVRLASEKAGLARLQLTGMTGRKADALVAELSMVQTRINEIARRTGAAATVAGIPVGSTIAERRPGAVAGTKPVGAETGTPTATATSTGSSTEAEPSAGPTRRGLGERLSDSGVTDPTGVLPGGVADDRGLDDAKDNLTDTAKDGLNEIPDEDRLNGIPDDVSPVGPVAPWRNPTSAELLANPALAELLRNIGGEAVKHSDPAGVAGGLTGGAADPRG